MTTTATIWNYAILLPDEKHVAARTWPGMSITGLLNSARSIPDRLAVPQPARVPVVALPGTTMPSRHSDASTSSRPSRRSGPSVRQLNPAAKPFVPASAVLSSNSTSSQTGASSLAGSQPQGHKVEDNPTYSSIYFSAMSSDYPAQFPPTHQGDTVTKEQQAHKYIQEKEPFVKAIPACRPIEEDVSTTDEVLTLASIDHMRKKWIIFKRWYIIGQLLQGILIISSDTNH